VSRRGRRRRGHFHVLAPVLSHRQAELDALIGFCPLGIVLFAEDGEGSLGLPLFLLDLGMPDPGMKGAGLQWIRASHKGMAGLVDACSSLTITLILTIGVSGRSISGLQHQSLFLPSSSSGSLSESFTSSFLRWLPQARWHGGLQAPGCSDISLLVYSTGCRGVISSCSICCDHCCEHLVLPADRFSNCGQPVFCSLRP